MVRLPEGFLKTKYPGYFYNYEDTQLYSIKSGILKPLKYYRGGFFNGVQHLPGYRISVKSRRILVTMNYLNSVTNESVEYIDVRK